MPEGVVLVLPGSFREDFRGKVAEPDSFLDYLEPYNCSPKTFSIPAGFSLTLLSFLITVPADPQQAQAYTRHDPTNLEVGATDR